MIKSIFVPMSGTATDESVLATALAIAKPLKAHLDFYHVRLSDIEAAVRTPPVEFCPASALTGVLAQLRTKEDTVANAAASHIEEFCRKNAIAFRSTPGDQAEMTARRLEEIDQSEERFVFLARHHDLAILGRPHTSDLVSYNLIETMLKHAGTPVVIAPENPPTRPIETVVVGWNESSVAARALTVALPLLATARNVVLIGIAVDGSVAAGLDATALHLEWHGIHATTKLTKPRSKSPPSGPELMALATQMNADLLVVGGYGHMPLREIIFGGVTQSLIEGADLPVLMMH
jgi:nucleotide-binding universal stress UspA family protein